MPPQSKNFSDYTELVTDIHTLVPGHLYKIEDMWSTITPFKILRFNRLKRYRKQDFLVFKTPNGSEIMFNPDPKYHKIYRNPALKQRRVTYRRRRVTT